MKTNSLAGIADRFFKECKKIRLTDSRKVVDLTPVINVLKHLSVDENYIIECLTPGKDGIGGETIVFARKRGRLCPGVKDIVEYGKALRGEDDDTEIACGMDPTNWVTVDGSPESIWEYHLFMDMWRFLPLWWHSNYANVKYITDADSLLHIAKITPEMVDNFSEEEYGRVPDMELPFGFGGVSDIRNAISLCGDEILLPAVRNEGELVETAYCYWSEWQGLVRTRIQSIVSEGKVHNIGRPHNTRLVNYECGIMY